MKVYKGKIITIDSTDSVKNYLVEDKGKILFTGEVLPDEFKNLKVINIPALIPTFADTHQHFASFAIFNSGLNVMEAESNEQILQMLSDFSKKSRDKILIAFGASPYSVMDGRLVSRQELDSVCSKPVFIVKYDGHACVINTALLKLVENKVKHFRGYHPDTGEMNQEAFFAISDYVTNSISIPRLIKSMKDAVKYEASKGIGMVHSVSGVGFPMDLDITTESLFSKYADKTGFQIRVFPQSMDVRTAISRRIPRIGGCFKCALDGCFGSQDAAMINPYEIGSDNRGVLYYSDDEVIDFCKKANRAGLQIEMHAIGDRAFNQAAYAIKAALDDYPRDDHRHGIIHACLPTENGMEICEEYHIQLPMQIAFDNWKQEPQVYTELLLGKTRSTALNPIKSFSDRECVVSFGSDGPCTEPNPVMWLDKAVNHSNPKQAVTIQQALRMATYNGYWASFDEKERGSLEVGKYADMVVLSDNPYDIPKEKLSDVKVECVLLKGKAIN